MSWPKIRLIQLRQLNKCENGDSFRSVNEKRSRNTNEKEATEKNICIRNILLWAERKTLLILQRRKEFVKNNERPDNERKQTKDGTEWSDYKIQRVQTASSQQTFSFFNSGASFTATKSSHAITVPVTRFAS